MINLVKYRKVFLVISTITMLSSLAAVLFFGLKAGIDFTGGTVIEVRGDSVIQSDKVSDLRQVFMDKQVEPSSIQKTNDGSLVIKTLAIDQNKWEEIKGSIKEKFGDFEELSFETIGPLLGKELVQKTITAVIITGIGLLFYIGWRFKNRRFGVTAIVAMIHDILVILGVFAVLGRVWGVEIDLMFVTATLTALAFSVHDTIVLYDRVRETLRRNPKENFNDVVNLAINSTLVRSLSTSLSVVFVLTALVLLGGETIRWFVVALLVGTISGSYSSPFTAAPLLTVWHDIKSK
ncbi:protein translocase subunit SecF [candidate division WWE3 bacterium]|nr:protein translocase subunit SecF [candidate division WWE3 bacterium]